MRLGLYAGVTAALAGGLIGAVANDAAASEPFRKGPYLQNVSQTSVTLMWESNPAQACTVELLGRGPEPARVVETEVEHIHEVVVDRLAPGRRYHYAVACDSVRTTGEFATAPDAAAPFMFVAFGDSRSNPGSHRDVVERVRSEVPDFILGTGDMVNEGALESDWQKFFDIERDLLRENVLFPSLGNHDRQGRGRTADSFRKYFALPENSPNPERYYAFTYGNSRFLVLDSNSYSFALTDQTAWIEAQLKAARMNPAVEHIFVAMHHPPFSISLHGGNVELRDSWTPLFEKFGVDAVFSGHDHCYERAEHEGVRYFVSGGGGAPLYPRHRAPKPRDLAAVKYIERVNHYLRVHVIGDFVEVTAFRGDGTVIESVQWGALPENAEALAALATGGRADDEPADESLAAVVATPESTRGTFGLRGKIGALMVLVAGAAILWLLRT